MIERVRNLIIRNCGRRANNLISKNIEKTLPNFFINYREKNSLILIELSCPYSLF
jgi:hypothetical protein